MIQLVIRSAIHRSSPPISSLSLHVVILAETELFHPTSINLPKGYYNVKRSSNAMV